MQKRAKTTEKPARMCKHNDKTPCAMRV